MDELKRALNELNINRIAVEVTRWKEVKNYPASLRGPINDLFTRIVKYLSNSSYSRASRSFESLQETRADFENGQISVNELEALQTILLNDILGNLRQAQLDYEVINELYNEIDDTISLISRGET